MREIGRSMVEMLGVLAIVGVLSLGAVWGIPYTMDKWKANQTIDEVRKLAVECSSQLVNKNTCDLGDFDTVIKTGYTWSLGIDPNDAVTFDIKLENVEMSICRKIVASGWETPFISLGTHEAMTSANCGEQNNLFFTFSHDLSELSPEEGGDCPPGVDSVCPSGSHKNCSGARIIGYCGCRECYPCEGFMGETYKTSCDDGRSCKSGGCVCDSGGCPQGTSNFCPAGAASIEVGKDNCGDACYRCEVDAGGCQPSCPAGSSEQCSGEAVQGSCGASCKKCLSCEGFVGNTYKSLCASGSICTTQGCKCSTGSCPTGQTTQCDSGFAWIATDKDGCGNQCYTCTAPIMCEGCENGAACDENGACVCVNGWTGDKCQICEGTTNAVNMCCQNSKDCGTTCCGEKQVCDKSVNQCKATSCPGDKPMNSDGTCADNLCYDDTQCPAGKTCYMGACTKATCVSDTDCIAKDATKPKCRLFSNPENNKCDIACKAPTSTGGNCPCNTDNDCLNEDGSPITSGLKYCDPYNRKCVACRADTDCDSGLCSNGSCGTSRICGVNVSGMSAQKCSQCSVDGTWFWNGTACCPSTGNTDNPFEKLTGSACYACGGTEVNGGCVKVDCTKKAENQTTETECFACGNKWSNGVCVARDKACTSNTDCGANKYCGGSVFSCHYATYTGCKSAGRDAYTQITIMHNGQPETWYIFNNTMSWWDARNACKAIGAELQGKEIVQERWRELGASGYQGSAWTNSFYNSCEAYRVDLSSGYLHNYTKTYNTLYAVCR